MQLDFPRTLKKDRLIIACLTEICLLQYVYILPDEVYIHQNNVSFCTLNICKICMKKYLLAKRGKKLKVTKIYSKNIIFNFVPEKV